MKEWIDYLIANISWIFSGIGVLALSGLVWLIRSHFNKSSNSQIQKIEGGSTGYQSGGDMSFGKEPNND
jgi:hypothetical protein